MTPSPTIAFIGGGNMARAIIGGLLGSGWRAEALRVSDPDAQQRETLAQRFGITCVDDNARCAAQADVVALAVKPQVMRAAVESLADALQRRANAEAPLLLSVTAGIRCDDILRWAGGTAVAAPAVVRAMPNTPALVNAGMSALFANERVTAAQREVAETLLRAVGDTLWVEREGLLDTVTAISGSGPAYFFKLMELLADSAAEHGLDPQSANELALQTAFGAATLAQQSAHSPAVLRRQVTSTGGVTEAALREMGARGLDDAIARGIDAAIRRSQQLADEFGGAR